MTERSTKPKQDLNPPAWMFLAGGALAAVVAFAFSLSKVGPALERASYDQLLRFGYPAVTNNIVLIQMDSDSYSRLGQKRGTVWGRTNHVHLLERLAADGCPLVIFDAYFIDRLDPASDEALAAALRKQRSLLAAKREEGAYSKARAVRSILPAELFLQAAGTNWGVAFLSPDEDGIMRRHWPFSGEASGPSLPWRAAELAGATLRETPQERWLRYYGAEGCWQKISYHSALSNSAGFFGDKIVFIGNKPATPVADGETDEFQTPYTKWGSETSGGVEILITEFLNLMNNQWLRRMPVWKETLMFIVSGLCLGVALTRLRPIFSGIAAIGAVVATVLGAATVAYYSNIWFPWLLIAGVQVPAAFVWSLAVPWIYSARAPRDSAEAAGQTVLAQEQVPEAPDYEIMQPAFAEGAYGKVWLVRNAVGQWQALKAIYREKFKGNSEPFEREFRGITRYKPFSAEHPGLLRVDFVSKKRRGEYFYYVMELGDSKVSGWEAKPETYVPLDLAAARGGTKAKRLPARECARLGLQLAEALAFLHEKGLTHRDIKPQNIIFVRGHPKLADVGLVAEAEGGEKAHTYVGTPGYMPMPPEQPGTVEADIYALGMVLYVTSTGREPAFFPELSSTLLNEDDPVDFMRLNPIIIKACHPDLRQRYASAAQLALDLRKLNTSFDAPLQ